MDLGADPSLGGAVDCDARDRAGDLPQTDIAQMTDTLAEQVSRCRIHE